MKVSYFNFAVAIWCAATALFISLNAGDSALVAVNAVLALFNLWLGLSMQKRGQ